MPTILSVKLAKYDPKSDLMGKNHADVVVIKMILLFLG
jgi:hypothetical protein